MPESIRDRFAIEYLSDTVLVIRCSSSTNPKMRYTLTADLARKQVSCSCWGNKTHGHCKHADAFKVLIGWPIIAETGAKV
jgi:hypothetical protein